MNCRTAAELLPWLLNGTLEGEERREALEHLRECDECRRELAEVRDAGVLYRAHPTADELYGYAARSLADPARAERVAGHLAHCADCAGELALIRESQQALLDRTTPEAEGSGGEGGGKVIKGPWGARRWQQLALAASLAAALVSGGWLWSALSSLSSERQLARQHEKLSAEIAAQSLEMSRLEEELRELRRAGEGTREAETGRLEALTAELDALRAQRREDQQRIAELSSAAYSPQASAPLTLLPVLAVTRGTGEAEATGYPVIRRSAGPRQTLQLTPNRSLGADRVRVELASPGGEVPWAETVPVGQGLSQDIVVTLSTRDLADGIWTVRLLSADGGDELRRFRFRVAP